jgi:hypothetical protein
MNGINAHYHMESISTVTDATAEKPIRCSSFESLSKFTTSDDKEKSSCRSSPVSVANIFDDTLLLQSIDQLPYLDPETDDFDEVFRIEHSGKQKKRVRFLLDEYGDIDEGVCLYSFPDYKLTSKLIKECWYKKEERIQAKLELQEACREHETTITNSIEYRDAMVKAITYLVQSDDDAEDTISLDPDLLQAMVTIVQSDTRGMERSMQFHMGLPRISTKTNIHAVLRIQALIRELDSTKYDEHEVDELIADQCLTNSQYGIRWAKMIAHGDAEVVRRSQENVQMSNKRP